MSVAATVCDALSISVGAPLTVVDARPWKSITFAGYRIELASENDLPANIEDSDPEMPGLVLVDLVRVDDRRLSATVLEETP